MSVTRPGVLLSSRASFLDTLLLRPRTYPRRSNSSWTCGHCQADRPLAVSRLRPHAANDTSNNVRWSRQFHSSKRLFADQPPPKPREDETQPLTEEKLASAKEEIEPIEEEEIPKAFDEDLKRDEQIYAAAADSAALEASHQSLPSHAKGQRSEFTVQMQKYMDDFLEKAALASQRVNTYTGTDYSGIEALRKSIMEQENLVKACLADVDRAKEAYTAAHSAQSSSQKEVVGLLERKQSWAAGDLERYMSLIRSEHVNEQAVQKAKDDMAEAERTLEAARNSLEKKERRQYHEEQIWSDTIRRNSTWVTFGLMGVNILLLLSNLAIIEPWRRRRLVREVRAALEEKTLVPPPSPAVEKQVDAVVAPSEVPLEKIEEAVPPTDAPVIPEVDVQAPQAAESSAKDQETVSTPAAVEEPETAGQTPMAAGEVLPEEAVDVVETSPLPQAETEAQPRVPKTRKEIAIDLYEQYKKVVEDLFSSRPITLKMVDVTTIAIEGVISGMSVIGVLLLMFRS